MLNIKCEKCINYTEWSNNFTEFLCMPYKGSEDSINSMLHQLSSAYPLSGVELFTPVETCVKV